MGTAVAKRSIWSVIADNPFPFFPAAEFRARVAERLQAFAEREGGTVAAPSDLEGLIFRLSMSDVPFPDGPGHSSVEVSAYRAYGRLTLAVLVAHDRLFRSVDGDSAGTLYLNDYKFVRSYDADAPPTIAEIDGALAGFDRARHAVERHNRSAAANGHGRLGRIRIAVRRTHALDPDDDQDRAPVAREKPIAHRRAELLEALRSQRRRPVRIRIRRRPPPDGDASDS